MGPREWSRQWKSATEKGQVQHGAQKDRAAGLRPSPGAPFVGRVQEGPACYYHLPLIRIDRTKVTAPSSLPNDAETSLSWVMIRKPRASKICRYFILCEAEISHYWHWYRLVFASGDSRSQGRRCDYGAVTAPLRRDREAAGRTIARGESLNDVLCRCRENSYRETIRELTVPIGLRTAGWRVIGRNNDKPTRQSLGLRVRCFEGFEGMEATGQLGCVALERLVSTRKPAFRALRPTKNGYDISERSFSVATVWKSLGPKQRESATTGRFSVPIEVRT